MMYLYCAYKDLQAYHCKKVCQIHSAFRPSTQLLVKVNKTVVFNYKYNSKLLKALSLYLPIYISFLGLSSGKKVFGKFNFIFHSDLQHKINKRQICHLHQMYRLSRTFRNVETFLTFALSLKSWSALATVILGNQNCQINILFLQIQIKIGDCICIMHMFPA